MTVGAILTLGFGSFGGAKLLPTLGYLSGGATPVQPTQNSGGWIHIPTGRKRTKADVRKDREDWGVLPKKAKQVIQIAALQQIAEPDNTDALIALFERADVAYKRQYEELLHREIERQLAMMAEEEEFILLH